MRILISHATEDLRAATVLKELIQRCSLRRIEVWFSSDQSAHGGITPGVAWFSDLLIRLGETDMIVGLVTPNSLSNPWLYFECGFIAQRGKSSIVPLALGIPLSDIPMPLAIYQGYDLSIPESTTTFLQKLFAIAEVPYDEDMTKALRESVAKELGQYSSGLSAQIDRPRNLEKSDIEALRQYLDKRFLELYSILPVVDRSKPPSPPVQVMGGTLRFTVLRKGKKLREFRINFSGGDSIQTILNRCYFEMSPLVEAFKYLQTWVIEEHETGEKLLLPKEDRGGVDATAFFDPTKSYKVLLLNRPYSESE